MEIFERNGGTKRMKMKKNSLQNSNSNSWVIGKYIDNVHINAEWKVLHENSPSPLSIHRKTYYLCCEKISTFILSYPIRVIFSTLIEWTGIYPRCSPTLKPSPHLQHMIARMCFFSLRQKDDVMLFQFVKSEQCNWNNLHR